MRLELVDGSGKRLTERDAEECRQTACRAGLHVIDKIADDDSWTLVVAEPAREIAIRAALQEITQRWPGIRVTVMA